MKLLQFIEACNSIRLVIKIMIILIIIIILMMMMMMTMTMTMLLFTNDCDYFCDVTKAVATKMKLIQFQ